VRHKVVTSITKTDISVCLTLTVCAIKNSDEPGNSKKMARSGSTHISILNQTLWFEHPQIVAAAERPVSLHFN